MERETDRQQRFDALFAAYGPDIVAYCGWRAGSAEDAQDAVADVFLTAWRRIDRVPDGDAARVWLYATARRTMANHRRSSRRRAALAERLAHDTISRANEPDRGESLVHDALLRLVPRDREVLLLAEWEGLAPAEIATVVGCPSAVFVTFGMPGPGPGVESAAAAVEHAATLTAASADRSGTAVVRITHDGALWADTTIRWHGDDLELTNDAPDRDGRVGGKNLVVDGMLYGLDPRDGVWVVMGSTKSIDPGSGTTPDEVLAAVREDVGGATLRRFTGGMTGLTTRAERGATVYRGSLAAGLLARESGFKEGRPIRVFPFGFVAHDAAADPSALLDASVTVGADGIVREIAARWGTWTYTVMYSGLGSTKAPVAPEHARPLGR